MNTLFIPLSVLYLVLLALYVHGRLTLRDRIVRECVAESMKREAEMRRLFRRDYDAVVEHRDKIVCEFRKMEAHARNVTLLEHQKQELNREIDAWKERARALSEEASRNERKANEAEAAVHRLYDAVKELQVVSVAIPDKNVKVRLPWDDRETRVGDIFDRACASVAIARSIMFPGTNRNSFNDILANMPSVLQQ